MTDEARMADDGCTQEPEVTLRAQVERAITQTIAAWQEVGVAEGKSAGMAQTRQVVSHAQERSAHLRELLERIPWGDA